MTGAPPVRVELRRVHLRLRQAHVAAHGTEHDRAVVLVAVTTADGSVGWGECSALARAGYTAEYHLGAWAELRDHLAPAVLAAPADHEVLEGGPMARAALNDALLDAMLRSEGQGLAQWAGVARTEVPSTTVVAVEPGSADWLRRVPSSGPVKVKIAPGWDLEPLTAFRALHPDRWLAADANGSYPTPDDVPDLTGLGLAYLEQPCPSIQACGEVQRQRGVVVAVDESVETADHVHQAAAAGVGVLNVKPARVGGVRAALRMVQQAAASGMVPFVGGMLETGVGRAAALAVAARPECTLPTDLGPSHRYWADGVELTAEIQAGPAHTVVVPRGPGIGVVPDPQRLDAATVELVVVQR